MMVLVLTACPAGLRGDLTKWLMEISPGTFVGRPSARIRELLWERAIEMCGKGQVILVYNSDNEQGLEFRTHNHKWQPVDFDGLTLIQRPTDRRLAPKKTGWSKARNMRRAQQR